MPTTTRRRRTITTTVPAAGRPRRAPRVPVLVVLHDDGYVEVFGEQVDVVVVPALAVERQDEATADEALTASLPLPYRDLHYPSKLVRSGLCERRTAEGELARRLMLHLVQECRAIAEGRAAQ